MWPVIAAAVRSYAPLIFWPVAVLVGAVGYNLEWWARGGQLDSVTIDADGVAERRAQRELEETMASAATKDVGCVEPLRYPQCAGFFVTQSS